MQLGNFARNRCSAALYWSLGRENGAIPVFFAVSREFTSETVSHTTAHTTKQVGHLADLTDAETATVYSRFVIFLSVRALPRLAVEAVGIEDIANVLEVRKLAGVLFTPGSLSFGRDRPFGQLHVVAALDHTPCDGRGL